MKQFDFNESRIFGKFDLYCKRVQKLMDMFTTIVQFTALERNKVEWLEISAGRVSFFAELRTRVASFQSSVLS